MAERTYHGQPVQTINGVDVIEMPDAGVPRCCVLCTFYGRRYEDDDEDDRGCTVPVPQQDEVGGLKCGGNNSFYVKANDDALFEYQRLAVLARMNGPQFPELQMLNF